MNGYLYEELVANYLKDNNYTDVVVTQASNDFGVDIVAKKGNSKFAVQCKYYTNAVGVEAVQQVVAGKSYYNCDKAIVITNSMFTKAAQELAQANNVILIQGIDEDDSCEFKVPYAVAQKATREHAEKAKKKDNNKSLKEWIIVAVIVGLISLSVNLTNEAQFNDYLKSSIRYIVFLGVIFLIYMLRTTAFHKTTRYYYPYIVTGINNIGTEFEQSDKRRSLDISNITGLPHILTIDGISYDLDNVEEINNIPEVFSKIQINHQSYYINNYLRMCAKVYKTNGYDEINKAILCKVAEIETDPVHGKFMRKQSKRFIKIPRSYFYESEK
ncbi:MAG: restriction endonuclease [Ruminococcus flavefaciens]|nr:restriction endonuclease [Ruminococcus flavefaciens]